MIFIVLKFLSTYIFVHLIRCLKRIRRSGVQTLIIIQRKYFLLVRTFERVIFPFSSNKI